MNKDKAEVTAHILIKIKGWKGFCIEADYMQYSGQSETRNRIGKENISRENWSGLVGLWKKQVNREGEVKFQELNCPIGGSRLGVMTDKLTHIRADGSAAMVDVSSKPVSRRKATARGFIRLQKETLTAISDGEVPKGDVLSVARIAGIQAAKQTPNTIPLCHALPLSKVAVDFEIENEGVAITALAQTDAKTGVEMEALVAVSVAALTIYDMCKAIDKSMMIEKVELLEKSKVELKN